MKFPVFLLGLVILSAGIGIVLWVGGVPVGKSLLWAVIAFGVGQVLYVATVAMLATTDKTSRRMAAKMPDTGGGAAARGLAAKQDRQA
jgi:bacteriorhodopsin